MESIKKESMDEKYGHVAKKPKKQEHVRTSINDILRNMLHTSNTTTDIKESMTVIRTPGPVADNTCTSAPNEPELRAITESSSQSQHPNLLELPEEVLLLIFEAMRPLDRLKVRGICRDFKRLLHDVALWKDIYCSKYVRLLSIFPIKKYKTPDQWIREEDLRHTPIEYLQCNDRAVSGNTVKTLKKLKCFLLTLTRDWLGNSAFDGECFKHIPQLESLGLSWNKSIKDRHLSHLTNLKVLILNGDRLITENSLSKLPLRSLIIRSDSAINKLPRMTTLRALTVDDRETDDMLKQTPNLITLSIAGHAKASGKVLRSLPKLKHLKLINNVAVKDEDLKGLGIAKLTLIGPSQLTDTGISYLKQLRRFHTDRVYKICI